MRDSWAYDGRKRFDKNGLQWHFVRRYFFDEVIGDRSDDDTPYELYFRSDDKKEYGLLRFASLKDNPYRDHESIVRKIMNNPPFRRSLSAPETSEVWRKPWK